MENIKKHIAVAISEFAKLHFSGAAVVPAGQVMSALFLANQEIEKLKAESKQVSAEESKTQTKGGPTHA